MKILLHGAHGRMGTSIRTVCKIDNRFGDITCIPLQKEDYESLSTYNKNDHIIMDFSHPKGTDSLVNTLNSSCLDFSISLLVGTTGLDPETLDKLVLYSKKASVLVAPNTSIGILTLQKIIPYLVASGANKITIQETHHVHKKDSPSGTALYLKECIAQHTQLPIKIESSRIGEVVGEHTVIFEKENELIQIQHSAFDRSLFAEGAIILARWLLKQSYGFYKPHDVVIEP